MNGFRSDAEAYGAIVGHRVSHADADPERLRAVEEVSARTAMMIAHGWKRRPWLPTSPGSPCTRRNGQYPEWDGQLTAGWFDHPYRLITDGGTIFVSEPYEIGRKGLVNLEMLASLGFAVVVKADVALHFPGHTTAVWIRRGAEWQW